MKGRFVAAAAIAYGVLATPAFATGGSGMRNGGSGMACVDGSFRVADSLQASLVEEYPHIEDRNRFFEDVMARVVDAELVKLIRRQWKAYGDSERWPSGDLEKVEVSYYVAPSVSVPYPKNGTIPATDPAHADCSFPAYAPDLCCDRVLLSYFGRKNRRPTKLESHYRRLTRYEKNVLELHEAVYRVAYDLGRRPPKQATPPEVQAEIDAYLARAESGRLPATFVETFIASLLSKNAPFTRDATRRANLEDFRAWSYAVYRR